MPKSARAQRFCPLSNTIHYYVNTNMIYLFCMDQDLYLLVFIFSHFPHFLLIFMIYFWRICPMIIVVSYSKRFWIKVQVSKAIILWYLQGLEVSDDQISLCASIQKKSKSHKVRATCKCLILTFRNNFLIAAPNYNHENMIVYYQVGNVFWLIDRFLLIFVSLIAKENLNMYIGITQIWYWNLSIVYLVVRNNL